MLPAGPHGADAWRVAGETGRPLGSLLDVSANLHPWGPPPGVRAAIRAALDDVDRYPPPHAEPLRDALSERIGAPVTVGNGATELLLAAVRGARRLWVRPPCYNGYAEVARAAGVPVVACASWEEARFAPRDVAVVGRPNNPDGRLVDVDALAGLARRVDRLVVDESFLGFTAEPSAVGLASNVVIVQSMTKTYAIPGLRLGWAWNLPEGALPPWSVNAVALAAGLACLDAWAWPREVPLDAWRADQSATVGTIAGVREVCGAANYLLLTLARPAASELRARLVADAGVLIRDASTIAGLDAHHVRIAVRTPDENRRVADALRAGLERR